MSTEVIGVTDDGDIEDATLMASEWVCEVCGEPVRGAGPPALCPKCPADSTRFALHEQPPGV
jgi:rubrerythrin